MAPSTRKSVGESGSSSVVLLSESLEVMLELAGEYERAGDLKGALKAYRTAAAFAEAHQGEDASIAVALQTLTMLIRRTEQMLAGPVAPPSAQVEEASVIPQAAGPTPAPPQGTPPAVEALLPPEPTAQTDGGPAAEETAVPPQAAPRSRKGGLIGLAVLAGVTLLALLGIPYGRAYMLKQAQAATQTDQAASTQAVFQGILDTHLTQTAYALSWTDTPVPSLTPTNAPTNTVGLGGLAKPSKIELLGITSKTYPAGQSFEDERTAGKLFPCNSPDPTAVFSGQGVCFFGTQVDPRNKTQIHVRYGISYDFPVRVEKIDFVFAALANHYVRIFDANARQIALIGPDNRGNTEVQVTQLLPSFQGKYLEIEITDDDTVWTYVGSIRITARRVVAPAR